MILANSFKRAGGKQLRYLKDSQACIFARTVPLFTDDVRRAVTESCVVQSAVQRSSVALLACSVALPDFAPVSETIFLVNCLRR